MEWAARQKIAVGAARGLRYLHEECRVGCIIHRDMRPNNILVTHDFEPLVWSYFTNWSVKLTIVLVSLALGTFPYRLKFPYLVQSSGNNILTGWTVVANKIL